MPGFLYEEGFVPPMLKIKENPPSPLLKTPEAPQGLVIVITLLATTQLVGVLLISPAVLESVQAA